jgi:hypothetical protein
VNIIFIAAVSSKIQGSVRIQQKETAAFARRIDCAHLDHGRVLWIGNKYFEAVREAGTSIATESDRRSNLYHAGEQDIVPIGRIGNHHGCHRIRAACFVGALVIVLIAWVSGISEDDFSDTVSAGTEELFLARDFIARGRVFTESACHL